ncbi:hypothetical protein [Psychromonas hadalis]|uniref:hypothetical protein n=1 Tax=Psychromonas hadalis TaxID=211669 RepID=UPI0003B5F8F7|nr:hypothetical protein [Psychromonas hadalis]
MGSFTCCFLFQSHWVTNHTADVNLLYPYLQDIGIDINKLKVDMKSQAVADIMQKDAQDAKVLKTQHSLLMVKC